MVTTFHRHTTTKYFPFDDSNRVYTDEHEVCVYGCTITPLTRTSVMLYDHPQRRWYELNIERPMPLSDHEEWFEQTVLEHITTHPEPFNTIDINKGIITHTVKETKFFARPIRPPIISDSTFPIAKYSEVSQKKYLREAVDTCLWSGIKCIYKQLDFDDYIFINAMQREISAREKLLEYYGHDTSLSEHGVCPILAIVVDDTEPLLLGFLMSNAGVALDHLPDGELTRLHLVSVIKTVKYLREAQVVHGDICERNVCISGTSLMLVDFGDVAPRYQGDIVAVGKLFQWCITRFAMEERAEIARAAEELIEQKDLDKALEILEGTKEVAVEKK